MMEKVKMKFKDAPIGARFKFNEPTSDDGIYVKIHSHGYGLIVKWNGNVEGHQPHCCWLDEENGYNFDTEIECIDDSLEIVNFDKMLSFAEHLNENWEYIDNLGPNRNIYARKDRKNDKAICYTTKEIFEQWNN